MGMSRYLDRINVNKREIVDDEVPACPGGPFHNSVALRIKQ